MVPQLRRRTRRSASAKDSNGSYSVRWTPALVDAARLERMADDMPGSMRALDRKVDAARADPLGAHRHGRRDLPRRCASGRSARAAAAGADRERRRRGVPRPARRQRVRRAGEARRRHRRRASNAGPGSSPNAHKRLIVQLDPPDDGDAWHLAVLARGSRGGPLAIERAIVMAGSERQYLEDEMARLERMLPVLLRPGGMRRGEVILSADEAWDLMATTGPRLLAAGFDVRAPAISRRRAGRRCASTSTPSSKSAVGANQLAERPMVGGVRRRRAHRGRHRAAGARKRDRSSVPPVGGSRSTRSTCKAAAEALAERATRRSCRARRCCGSRSASTTHRSRVGVSIEGGGWAADLLAAAADVADRAGASTPRGFVGDAAQLSGRGAGVARLPRLGRAGRVPRARHGSRQDADDARPRARRRRAGPDAGDRAAGGRRQLDGRGRALHARACASSCTTARTAPRPTRSRPRSPTPTWS